MENTDYEGSQNDKQKREKKTFTENLKVILSYLHDLVCLIAAIMLIFSFCFRVVVVSGNSMNNTLYSGDSLLVLGRVFYSKPKVGDIVVISKDDFDNGEPIIKRVIATEGQEVNIIDGCVYVDNKLLDEKYGPIQPTVTRNLTIYDKNNYLEFPLKVKEGCIFVLGDNRPESLDSRRQEIGLVDTREVLGRAIFLFYPGVNRSGQRTYSRIGGLS